MQIDILTNEDLRHFCTIINISEIHFLNFKKN